MSISKHLDEVKSAKKERGSSRTAKRIGSAIFKTLGTLLQQFKISNDSNRDVELEEPKTFLNKLGHLIRYVCGISSKSQMLITILKDGLDDIGYIRDDGTLSSLALIGGEYYNRAMFTPNQLVELIEEIDKTYEPNKIDRFFIDQIEAVLATFSEEQMKLNISWEDIVEANDKIKEFYFNTELGYEINLYTLKQHQLDMRNANLQPNPWIAFQYYWVPNKLLSEYKKTLLGKDLFEFVSNKDGLAYSTAGKIMGKLNPNKKAMKRAEQLQPLVLSYVGSEFCDTKEDFKKFIEMVARFGKHNDTDVFNYWSKMFKKFVKEVKYSEIETYYNEKYFKVYSNSIWGNGSSGPNHTLKEMIKKTGQNSCDRIEKFNISVPHNGVVFISFAIWAKGMYGKGWDKTIELIVNQYCSVLEGKISLTAQPNDNWTTGTYDMWEALLKGYIKTAVASRIKYVFGPMMDGVEDNINKRKQDRYHQKTLRSRSLEKHYDLISGEVLPSRLTLFPLASNGSLTDTVTINFGKGDGLQWLHPNDDENKAKDGFLGIVDDNLVEPLKSMDWTPYIDNNSNYWKLVLEHNEKKWEQLDGTLKKKISMAMMVLEHLSNLDLNV